MTLTAPQASPMLALATWYGALVGFGWLIGFREHAAIFMTIGVVSAVGASAWMMRLGTGKAGALVVTAETITVGQRSVARAGLQMSVAAWKQPHLWTVIGTALELSGPRGKLCVGGTGHLPPRRALGTVTRVDASLSAEDFADLSRTLGVENEIVLTEASAFKEIDLVPSRTGAAGALGVMTPWLVTMGLAGSVGVLGSSLGLEQSPVGLGVMLGLTIAIVLTGLVFTFRKSARAPDVKYRLIVGPGSVQLLDVNGAGGAAPAAMTPDRVTPVTYRYVTKYGTYEFPAVRLDWSHRRAMVIGSWDTTKAWNPARERSRRLDYLVGNDEWRFVVDAIGGAT